MPNERPIIFADVVFALVQSFTFDEWLPPLEYNHICCDLQEVGPLANDLGLRQRETNLGVS